MAGNSFGNFFRITTFGESHGPAVGVVIDGVTPKLPLGAEDIQKQLDRRKPGQSPITSPRKEPDRVEILSGTFEGLTTGTPIMLLVRSVDMKSGDYESFRHLYRPGHGDKVYEQKYGIRDYRGGGRSSGRETTGRVAAGAVARKCLESRGVSVTAYTLQAAGIKCKSIREVEIEENAMRAPDNEAAALMLARMEELMARGESAGGIVELRIRGVVPGLGDPVFDKLDADLAKALLSVGSIKGIEFGAGFAAADMLGSEHNRFGANNAGGIIAGISTGEEIVLRLAVKPTPSVSVPQTTVDNGGNTATITIEGRHDPTICPRIVPVVEAMACLVLEDHYKRQAALHG